MSHAITDPWTDRLSEHLDGSLTEEERGLLDAHLVTCAECRSARADLERVVIQARALPEFAPDEDLWPGIAARVAAFARTEEDRRPARPRRGGFVRGITLSWPQLVAAGFTLVVLSGAVAWSLGRGKAAQTAARPVPTATLAEHVDPQYAAEVEDLKRVLDERRSQLDPETVKTIEANLQIIDLASTQVRQALAADPGNPYLKETLSKNRRKVELLKQAAVYATAQ